jgi:hypothetical protein
MNNRLATNISLPRNYWLERLPESASECFGDFAAQLDFGGGRRAGFVGDVAGKDAAAAAAAGVLKAYVQRLIFAYTPLSTIMLAIDEFFKRVVYKDDVPFATLFILGRAVAQLCELAVHRPRCGVGYRGRVSSLGTMP